jgi:hypothetical protein
MTIRFTCSFPEVKDEDGAFQIHVVNFGPSGLTFAEKFATDFRALSPTPRMVVVAVYGDDVRGLVGIRLSKEDFPSVSAAVKAMKEGFEVIAYSEIEALARRLIKAKAADSLE